MRRNRGEDFARSRLAGAEGAEDKADRLGLADEDLQLGIAAPLGSTVLHRHFNGHRRAGQGIRQQIDVGQPPRPLVKFAPS